MAQNITLMGANYSAVPAVTLPKTGGGTASFTDVTDTTAAAADVASGKYFYTSAGVRTQGTNSGGGGDITVEALSVTQNGTYTAPTGKAFSPVTVNVSGAQTTTGTFTGGGGITQSISCPFAPDLIYVHGDLSSDPSLRGVSSVIIIKNTALYVISDGSSSASQQSLWQTATNITDYNETNQLNEPYATYSNGTLSFNMVENTSSARFNASITYSYMLIKWS